MCMWVETMCNESVTMYIPIHVITLFRAHEMHMMRVFVGTIFISSDIVDESPLKVVIALCQ